jgi:hypothetical protein
MEFYAADSYDIFDQYDYRKSLKSIELLRRQLELRIDSEIISDIFFLMIKKMVKNGHAKDKIDSIVLSNKPSGKSH